MRLLLILLLLPAATWAQTHEAASIHRCVDANGQSVFTDRMCADVQATPALPAPSAPVPVAAAATPSAPPPIMCAGNLDELKQAVVDAFAARDANRLTGLMLWNGYGKSSVISTTRMLSTLMGRTLLDLDTSSAEPEANNDAGVDRDGLSSTPPDDSSAAAPPPDHETAPTALILRTSGTDGSGAAHETRLGISRRSGCLWLRPPG